MKEIGIQTFGARKKLLLLANSKFNEVDPKIITKWWVSFQNWNRYFQWMTLCALTIGNQEEFCSYWLKISLFVWHRLWYGFNNAKRRHDKEIILYQLCQEKKTVISTFLTLWWGRSWFVFDFFVLPFFHSPNLNQLFVWWNMYLSNSLSLTFSWSFAISIIIFFLSGGYNRTFYCAFFFVTSDLALKHVEVRESLICPNSSLSSRCPNHTLLSDGFLTMDQNKLYEKHLWCLYFSSFLMSFFWQIVVELSCWKLSLGKCEHHLHYSHKKRLLHSES